MNFFHHKDLGNHLLQLCPKVVKHPVYDIYYLRLYVQLVEALRYRPGGRGFESLWSHWEFFSLTQSYRPHCGPGVDSASNKNEYQEYFMEVKAVGA